MPLTLRILLFLFLLNEASHAQQIYNHRVYDESNGMASSNIVDMTQSTDGVIWLNTLVGVSSYDGNKWINYSSEEYNLPKGFKTKIHSAEDGKVWTIGYLNDNLIIRYWHKGQWHKFPSPPFKSNIIYNFYFDLFLSVNTLKLVVGHHEVYEYSFANNVWKNISYNDAPDPKRDYTYDLKYDDKGVLWACTYDGVKKYNSTKWETIFSNSEDKKAFAICFSKKESVPYVLGDGVINYVENDSLKKVLDFKIDKNSDRLIRFSNILIDKSNSILFNNFSPLFKVENNKANRVYFDNVLKDVSTIRKIFEDRENNIWLATSRGLVKLSNSVFKSYSKSSGLIEDEVSSIVQLQNEKTILLGANKGVTSYNNKNFETTTVIDSELFNNKRILRALEDKDGTIYFAGGKLGLGIWDRKNKIKWIPSPHYRYPTVGEIFFEDDNLYVICVGDIYKLEKEYTFSKVYSQEVFIRKAQKMMNGEILLLSDTILSFNKEVVSKKYTYEVPQQESTYGIVEWNNELIVGTRLGLYKIESNQIVPTIINQTAIDHSVYGLLVDSRNNLWVGTANGIYQFTDSTVNHFNQSNGLIGNEINRNALIEDREENIWIGTNRGVSIFNYDTYFSTDKPPLVQLKEIRTDEGKVLINNDKISLNANENDIEFEFVGVSFKDEESINYRFRLNGHNNNWQYLPSNDYPKIRYTNLQFGTYTFEVQSRNKDGQWSNSVFSGKITIKRPFLQSPLFYVASFFSTLLIGYLISSYFNNRNIQQKLKSTIDEKIYEIEVSKNELKRKNDDLMSSITYAQRIQGAILTSQNKIANSLPNHFLFYKPKDVVSGDFYWCEEIDNKCIIIVGDCTGHGVPGALMTMLATQALNDIIIQKGIYQPDNILENLDNVFKRLLRSKKTSITDGMDVAICVIDKENNQIRFSGAKCSIIMIHSRELREYKGDNFSINDDRSSLKEYRYKLNHINYVEDDFLYLFTDGFQDQFGGVNNKKLKKEGWRKLLYLTSQKPINHQKLFLENNLNDWMGKEPQVDDILVMGIQL